MLRHQRRVARQPVVVAGVVAAVLATAYLLLPVAGTDLSAQVARAEFVRLHGMRPVDFGWYGGVFPSGYSLLTGPLDAVVGPRLVGALAAVAGAVAFAYLLTRARVQRPVLGGLLGAASMVFNVVSGRTTFAVGLALGLLATCLVPGERAISMRRTAAPASVAALSAAASPVAGVFLAIAGVALIIAGRRRGGAAVLAGAAGPLLLAAVVFTDGGVSPFSADQATIFVVLSLFVVILVPAPYPAVRIGAALTAVAVLAGHLVNTPLGGNTARLPLLFAGPVVAATAALPPLRLAVAVAAMLWWQPPLVTSDVRGAGERSTSAGYFAPLVEQLHRYQPIGRVEVVPLRNHWEATYIAEAVPLARGWERQADVGRNRLFYAGSLTAGAYRRWLSENAVALVAVPRAQMVDPAGAGELALIGTGLPYLRQVWASRDWQLYTVQDAQPIVSTPGRLLSSDQAGVSFDTDRPGRVIVRLRFSRWTTLAGPDGGCIAPARGWTAVTVARAGRYRISSDWHVVQSRRC